MEQLDDLATDQIPAIDALPEVSDRALRSASYVLLADVEGVSCKRSYKGPAPSWEDAIRRTKYKALQKGANAIANLSCGLPEGKSLTTMCLDSIRCTASAIRIDQ